ncbi:alpha/beta hydrolase [Ulvibacterium marinum]|uniref:Alpha/beta hydrolase n=1 Tax=Ulvibacterium marinum TaxID=2419782 RepID=A0A3B0CA61_9FLAO|nr:alpha/beta hydrolase [Ulvibacterium marinum]RKN80799.1 alpha/beta hydrolase [Ulvibacterium marinum]
MKKQVLIFIGLMALLSGCKSEQHVSIPPKGYSSNAMLKMAYAAGTLKIVETDFPIPETIKEYKDVTYKTLDSIALKLDIYHTKSLKGKAPLIIFIHGGSWKKGNKDDYLVYLTSYAEKGYVTATVQYRLAGVAKFPAQLLDVQDAVVWLKQNADAFHIDPGKVALVGGSAGGHLAMMNAFTNSSKTASDKDPFTPKVQALVNFYGPCDLIDVAEKDKPTVEYFIGKSEQEAPELYKAASPLYFITKMAPPTITFHGTLDELVPYEQSDRLHEKLEELGVPSYYHKLEGWPHTLDASVKVNAYAQYHMDRFFEKHIPKN